MPSIKHSTAAIVNPKFFRIIRSANHKSCLNVSISAPTPI